MGASRSPCPQRPRRALQEAPCPCRSRARQVRTCDRTLRTKQNKKLRRSHSGRTDGAREGREVRLRTCGYECLGGCLACEMGEREGRANPFERTEVPEDHRGLTGPETEDGLVGLAPLLVEQSRASRRVRARRALNTRKSWIRPYAKPALGERTYAFKFFCYLNEAQLDHSLEEPCPPVAIQLPTFKRRREP